MEAARAADPAADLDVEKLTYEIFSILRDPAAGAAGRAPVGRAAEIRRPRHAPSPRRSDLASPLRHPEVTVSAATPRRLRQRLLVLTSPGVSVENFCGPLVGGGGEGEEGTARERWRRFGGRGKVPKFGGGGGGSG
ncbi:unnamed protein product [Urochloa humidicola]